MNPIDSAAQTASRLLDRAFASIQASRARRGEGGVGMGSIDTPAVRAMLLRHPDLVEQMLSARSAVGRKLRDHTSTASANPEAYVAWAAAQHEAKARGAACDDRFEVEIDCAHADIKPWTLDDVLSDRDIADDLHAKAARLELLIESYKERLEEARYYADRYGDLDGRRAEHIKDLQRKAKRCREFLKDLRARIERLDCVQVLTLLRALALVAIEQELEDVKDPKFRTQAVAWLSSHSERPISFRWWARLAGVHDVEQYQLNVMRTVHRVLAELAPAPAPATQQPVDEIERVAEVAETPVAEHEASVDAAAIETPPPCPVDGITQEPRPPRRAGLRHGRVLLLVTGAPRAAGSGFARRDTCRSPPHGRTKEGAPARRRTKNQRSNNDDVNQLFRLSALTLALVAGAAHADYDSAVQSLQAGQPETAMQEFMRLAASDDPRANDAACAIGAMHFDARAFDLAVPLLERAAAGGSAGCQFLLGRLFVTGTGVERNEARGFALMKASADGGNLTAMVELGRYYLNGKGVAKDPQLALASMRRAAEGGLAEGQLALGQAYYWGWAGKVDVSVAAAWVEKAAAQGYPTAQAFFAIMLYEGRGVPRNDTRALDLFLRAAEMGVATAQYGAGMMFELGHGTAVDYMQAKRWYQRAAEQGDGEAEVALGLLAYNGRGRPADASVAFSHFLTAAQAGDAQGMQYVGFHLETGEGVERDLDAARGWYAKAAEKGNAVARERLAALSK